MTEEQETAIARLTLRHAESWARAYSKREDEAAAIAAILCRALELATPELSPQGRARLFMEEELPPSSLEQKYDFATYGDWISNENQQ
jgi:hypothetical protein